MGRNSYVNEQYRNQRTEDLARFANDTGCEIQWFSPYQARIDGIVDVYPTNGRYHVLASNIRGSYRNLKDLRKLLNEVLQGKYNIKGSDGLPVRIQGGDDMNEFDELMAGMRAVIKSAGQDYYLYLIKGATGRYRADYSNHSGKPYAMAEGDTPTEAVQNLKKLVDKMRGK